MTVWYAQATGNISVINFNDDPGGLGNSKTYDQIASTDELDANGQDVAIDVDGLVYATLQNDTSNGSFTYALAGDNTLSANIATGLEPCLVLSHTSGNSLTLTGDVTGGGAGANDYGIHNTSTGALNVIGDIQGGAGGTGHGITNVSTGILTVTGDLSGGSGTSVSSYGIWNQGNGTVNITGNVTGGSGSSFSVGVHNNAAGVVTIKGNVSGGTGSLARGAINNSTGTMTITGDISGGTGANAAGVQNASTGSVTINLGTLSYDPTMAGPFSIALGMVYLNFGKLEYATSAGSAAIQRAIIGTGLRSRYR